MSEVENGHVIGITARALRAEAHRMTDALDPTMRYRDFVRLKEEFDALFAAFPTEVMGGPKP